MGNLVNELQSPAAMQQLAHIFARQAVRPTLHRGLLRRCACLAIVFLLAGAPRAGQAQLREPEPAIPIPIGVVGPLSGDYSQLFRSSRKAIEMAAAVINSEGGVDKRRLRLFFADSRGTAAGARAAAEGLIRDNEVTALITGLSNAEVLAVLPVSKEANIPQLVFSADDPSITRQGGDQVFRVNPSAELIYGNLVDYVVNERRLSSIALIGPNTNFTRRLSEFLFAFAARRRDDTTFLTTLYYGPRQTNFATLLSRLKVLNPRVVLLNGSITKSGLIVRQSRKMGWKVQFLGGPQLAHPIFYDITDDSGNGLLVGRGYEPSQMRSELARTYQRRRPRFNAAEKQWHAFAYDTVVVLAEVFKKVAPGDEGLFDEFRRKDFKGVTGNFTFSRSGEAIRPIYISEWQDGAQLKVVKVWNGFKLDLR